MFWQPDVPRTPLTRQLCGIIFTSAAPSSLIYSSGTPHPYISKCVTYTMRHRAGPRPSSSAGKVLRGRGTSAQGMAGGEADRTAVRRQTHFKSRRRFQGQQSLSYTLPCKRHCFSPSQPCCPSPALESPGRWEAPRLGHQGRSMDGEGKGWPWRHLAGLNRWEVQRAVPTVSSPKEMSSFSLRKHTAISPSLSGDQGAASIGSTWLHNPSVESSELLLLQVVP